MAIIMPRVRYIHAVDGRSVKKIQAVQRQTRIATFVICCASVDRDAEDLGTSRDGV